MFTTDGIATATTSDCAWLNCVRTSTDLDDRELLAEIGDIIPRYEDSTSPMNMPKIRINATHKYKFFLLIIGYK